MAHLSSPANVLHNENDGAAEVEEEDVIRMTLRKTGSFGGNSQRKGGFPTKSSFFLRDIL